MANLFGNDLSAVSSNDGPILNNIAKQAVVTESVLTLLADNSVTAVHISAYGKDLLNTTSLNTLRTALLSDNEEAIAYNGGDNLEEINFHTYASGQTAGASNLRFQIKGTKTIVKNILLASGNIETDTVETANIKSSSANAGVIYLDNFDSTSRFRFVSDANHYIQTDNNIITFSKWFDGQFGLKLNHTNSTCEIPYNLISPTINTSNIRFTGEATDAITLSSNLINCSKNVQINVTNNNFGLFVAPNNNNQACLYSGKQYGTQAPSGLLVQGFFDGADLTEERCALKINNYSNGAYRDQFC